MDYQNLNSILTNSASGKQSTRLSDKSIDEGLTPFPEVDWNGHYVANVAKCSEWTMQEEGEQISIVLMICN